MKKQKSERHHWWPEGVSERWKNADGMAHWLKPNGETVTAPPKNFGVIGNGHFIKLGQKPEDVTPWDENFEKVFQKADDDFPRLIDWMEGLERKLEADPRDVAGRYLAQTADDATLAALTESVVSLAVRSPMNRQAACGLAEKFRGPLPSRERNSIIGLNMRLTQRRVSDVIGSRAKFCVIFSPQREFIFGDGFFSNIRSPGEGLMTHRVLAPITPNLAVLIVRPQQCRPDPRLVTLVATPAEVDAMNQAVQIYARDALFYRSERPEVTDAFRQQTHLLYAHPGNPLESLIHTLPGVPPRNTSLDHLAALLNRD